MPGSIRQWPAWPEYTSETATSSKDPEFLEVKKAIISHYGAEALQQSWIKVCKELEKITEEIIEKGNTIVPVFDTQQIIEDGFSPEQETEIKRIGSFVCRNTVHQEVATTLYSDLKTYVANNKSSIQAWPKESPSMLVLYNSPTQNTLRSHPNHLKLQRKLNELWKYSAEDTSPDPLVYLDGIRDRAPGQPFLGLGPHIDAGSLCRWADPTYRKVYDEIFSGRPEDHDAYDVEARKNADQELYKGLAHSTVLRTFQGWTALTPTAPREGTIMVYPDVKTVIAYLLLRPFFSPPKDPDQIMDAAKWTFDDSAGWFPGTMKPESQRLSRSSHPHLRLEECLIHMPEVQPGDTVWWHCDVCHAVDTEHLGKNNASVAFIAACPTTPANEIYVKEQLLATLEGRPSADYAHGNNLDESTLKGYVGLDGLNDEAPRTHKNGAKSTPSRSRKEVFPSNVEHRHIDLTGNADGVAKNLQGITAEYIFFAAYLEEADEQKNWDVNGHMIQAFLDALVKSEIDKKLKRFLLLGKDLIFPGSERFYTGFDCFTSADLHAKFCEWVVLESSTANEPFNVVNGDVESWQNLWPKVAERFGTKVDASQFQQSHPLSSSTGLNLVPPISLHEEKSGLKDITKLGKMEQMIDLTKWSQQEEVKEAWKKLAKREGLDEKTLDGAT
ncbi:DUF1479 domain [Fusarium agapanthi]|uniref:DUF1479 domain n=1 Tax=Fusarium agapanthi TaxID=1803897 RepID=A0A9P5BDX2_9HYPO|nr:DUF1479 domain [Fusarium agapanthi]